MYYMLLYIVACRYQSQGDMGTQHTTITFHLLLDAMKFFDSYHAQKWDQAHEVGRFYRPLPPGFSA